MKTDRILQTIEENLEKYLDFLCKICSFEAKASDKETIDQMIDFIADFAEKEGFQTLRKKMARCGDFLSIDFNSDAEKSCFFLAHTDTVHEKGAFGDVPVVRLEDKIIAPGAIDCKGGIAIALLAMKALMETGYKKHLRLILTSDEEVSGVLGGKEEKEYFEQQSAGFRWAINCETSENDEVVLSRKGILRYRIDIKGASGHSGIHYFQCKNAIEEAAYKIIALQNRSEKGGITYSCNMIQSGTALNIIPEECSVSIDVRVPRHRDMPKADRVVKEIAEKDFIGGTKSSVTAISQRPPMEKNQETEALFEDLLSVCHKYSLGTLTPVESGGGSDSCYTQTAGVPSICGMGGCGKGCHTNREYIEVDSVFIRAKILSLFLVEKEKQKAE